MDRLVDPMDAPVGATDARDEVMDPSFDFILRRERVIVRLGGVTGGREDVIDVVVDLVDSVNDLVSLPLRPTEVRERFIASSDTVIDGRDALSDVSVCAFVPPSTEPERTPPTHRAALRSARASSPLGVGSGSRRSHRSGGS